MLPQIQLTEVMRDDVKRVADWLKDEEIAESWFGRYTYGEPAHLGYDPDKMLLADVEEWKRVFKSGDHHPHRDIFSIRTSSGEHIGEAQLAIDEALGDAQISVLIGRKDLWHRGYGTATTLALLDHIFIRLSLYRAWVDVPEYNTHAREMFEHVGFVHEGTLRQSRPHQGARFNSVILGMLRSDYERRYPQPPGAGPVHRV
ncbi:MAG: GNAT family N-acetyltransferase [Chloroflexi bacterium]|nr:GNAT family N-acetyltransferase [Chloroflexota bacterium]